jgi:hypothetical protein
VRGWASRGDEKAAGHARAKAKAAGPVGRDTLTADLDLEADADLDAGPASELDAICTCSLCTTASTPGGDKGVVQQLFEQQKPPETDAPGGAPGQGASPAPASPPANAPAELQAENADALGQLLAGAVGVGTPGNFPVALGLTTPNYDGFEVPTLQIQVLEEKKPGAGFGSWLLDDDMHWVARIMPTHARDATHPAIAMAAGTYDMKSSIELEEKKKKVPYKEILELTSGMASKVAAAEQEHLDDLKLAYELTLKAGADAINAMGGQEFSAPAQTTAEWAAKDALKAKLHTRLTYMPEIWKSVLIQLISLSKTERDDKQVHTMKPDYTTAKFDFKAKTVTYQVTDGESKIGSISPASIIKL